MMRFAFVFAPLRYQRSEIRCNNDEKTVLWKKGSARDCGETGATGETVFYVGP